MFRVNGERNIGGLVWQEDFVFDVRGAITPVTSICAYPNEDKKDLAEQQEDRAGCCVSGRSRRRRRRDRCFPGFRFVAC